MNSFRGSLISGLADLAPDQILDVMGYIKSRGRYLSRLQRWVCLRAYNAACERVAIAVTGITVEQCRDAATRMLKMRQALQIGEPLTQVIEGGALRIGPTHWPYDWNGPRLTVAGHQFMVRELLAAKEPAPPVIRRAMPLQLDLFGAAEMFGGAA